jgi:drug/metabolite transporter (DMT)-like permease
MGYRAGVAMVLAAGVLWSFMGLAIRLIPEAGTWAVVFYRSLGMVPVLLIFIALRSGGRPWAVIRGAGIAGVIGGGGLIAAFLGAIYAIQTTSVANAVFLYSASPFFSALLGRIVLGERVRPATWCAIALAAVGIAVMVREGLAVGALAGDAAALTSALGFASFTVALRWGRVGDMYPAVLLGGVFTIALAAAAIWAGTGTLVLAPRDAGIAMGMGAGLLASGMVIYTLGSRVVPASDLALFSMTEVMLGPVWVWLFLGEQATPGALTGGAILLAAIAGNALSGARARGVT